MPACFEQAGILSCCGVVRSKERLLAAAVDADLVDHGVRPMLDEEGGDLRDILRQDHILAGQVGPRNAHHVGEHAAGADKVDADILTVDLAGERLREPGQRVLGGGVGALQRIALVRDDGGDVENGRALRAAGGLDILVNNAGIALSRSFEETRRWRR